MRYDVILLTGMTGASLDRLIAIYTDVASVAIAHDRPTLEALTIGTDTTLISFGTGVVVRTELLDRLRKPAYNLHAASPEFPGRDPHHHAIYRGATEYGATLHVMTKRVDAGPIVAVDTFPVTETVTPQQLLDAANEAGMQLLEKLGTRLLHPDPLPTLQSVRWGRVKTARSDLRRLCELSPLIAHAEFERRYRAFECGRHSNLTTRLHGHLFRIEKGASESEATKSRWVEFTEDGFRDLLRQLKASDYTFARYGEVPARRHVLWRHDVDFSMHRAGRLAEIEAREGVIATYFLNPRCIYYNLLEPEIEAIILRILAAGHEIGLHFDAAASSGRTWTTEALESAVAKERRLLEFVIGRAVSCVSWHNPDLSNLLAFDAEIVGGLANVYGARYREAYTYASDSNGYWRFKPMASVIAENHSRLHLLTHPELWTPQPMSPTERIDRCILGRARAARLSHDTLMKASGRRHPQE